MKYKILIVTFTFFVQFAVTEMALSQEFPVQTNDTVWSVKDSQGENDVHLYVYWSHVCPHCERALPYMKKLESKYPWLKLHLREVSKDQGNLESLYNMADNLEEPTSGEVPAFFFCGLMYTGYSEDHASGEWINDTLLECRDQ